MKRLDLKFFIIANWGHELTKKSMVVLREMVTWDCFLPMCFDTNIFGAQTKMKIFPTFPCETHTSILASLSLLSSKICFSWACEYSHVVCHLPPDFLPLRHKDFSMEEYKTWSTTRSCCIPITKGNIKMNKKTVSENPSSILFLNFIGL